MPLLSLDLLTFSATPKLLNPWKDLTPSDHLHQMFTPKEHKKSNHQMEKENSIHENQIIQSTDFKSQKTKLKPSKLKKTPIKRKIFITQINNSN